jgi:hypothetical protein
VPTTLLIDADGKVVWKDQSANYTQRSDPDFVGAAKIRKTNQRFPYQAKYTHCSRSTKRLVLSLNFSQQGILLPDHGCLAHINTRRFHSHRNEQAAFLHARITPGPMTEMAPSQEDMQRKRLGK